MVPFEPCAMVRGSLAMAQITANEKSRFLSVDVSLSGVENFYTDGSFVTDELASFSMWREYLWQDYKDCYFDPERGEYVPK